MSTDVFLLLSETDIEVLREREAQLTPKHDVQFAVCVGCAMPRFQSSRLGEGKTEAVLGSLCDACQKFRFRHPEVFDYLIQFHSACKFIESRLPKKKAE